MRCTALLTQCKALAHAKAVLFIRYNKPKLRKFHVVLNYCVRSGKNVNFPAFNRRFHGAFFLLPHRTRKQPYLYSKRRKHFFQSCFMLCGKHLCRSHNGTLKAVFRRNVHTCCGNSGFSAADISLNKAVHGSCGAHIFLTFCNYSFLSTRKLKAKRTFKRFRAHRFKGLPVCASGLSFGYAHSKRKVKKLLKNKSSSRFAEVIFTIGEMNLFYCLINLHKTKLFSYRQRNRIFKTIGAKCQSRFYQLLKIF